PFPAPQVHRISPVGLDSSAALLRYQRGRHYLACQSLPRQVPIQVITTWSRFINEAQLFSRTCQFAHYSIQRVQLSIDAPIAPHLSVAALLSRGDLDRLFVLIHTHIHDRLSHGLSP